jgi:site-specific DNA recombinase
MGMVEAYRLKNGNGTCSQYMRPRRRSIKIALAANTDESSDQGDHHRKPNTITVPFIVRGTARKGCLHQARSQPVMATETRATLLKAIGRARGWLDELLNGDANSFDEIAQREGLVERHVRFLMPLAFVAPRIIEAIADGTAPADLTVTRLAKGLPSKWADQAKAILGG